MLFNIINFIIENDKYVVIILFLVSVISIIIDLYREKKDLKPIYLINILGINLIIKCCKKFIKHYKKIIILLITFSLTTMIINYHRIKKNLNPVCVINILPADCDIYYSGLGYHVVEVRDCKVDEFVEYKFILGFWEIDYK